ncbi:hypothetical protein P7C70_g7781, partial [Phenoliferia sp. Uapishka_3]
MSDPSSSGSTDAYAAGGGGAGAMSTNGSRRGSDGQQQLLSGPHIMKGGMASGSRAESPSNGGGSGGSGQQIQHQHQQRYGGPASGYEFGSSFGGGSPGGNHPHQGVPTPFQHPQPPPHPNSNYRFGGPPPHPQNNSPGSGPGGPAGENAYFDYSMRRHSLTNNPNAGHNSPPRLPSIDSAIPSPGVKRKSSVEDSIQEDYPYNAYPQHRDLSNVPYNKRRGSGLNYERNGSISAEHARREAMGA